MADLVSGFLTSPEFTLHEVDDVREAVKLDDAKRTNCSRALDVLHKTAFRSGLGNSLFSSLTNVNSVTSESLQEYAHKHLVGGNIAVTGLFLFLGKRKEDRGFLERICSNGN